jgi:hypothetical protein
VYRRNVERVVDFEDGFDPLRRKEADAAAGEADGEPAEWADETCPA